MPPDPEPLLSPSVSTSADAPFESPDLMLAQYYPFEEEFAAAPISSGEDPSIRRERTSLAMPIPAPRPRPVEEHIPPWN